MDNETLLKKLAQSEGKNVMEMLQDATFDSIAAGICTECGYTTNVEPDMNTGYCESCGKQTVKSCLVLAGVL